MRWLVGGIAGLMTAAFVGLAAVGGVAVLATSGNAW